MRLSIFEIINRLRRLTFGNKKPRVDLDRLNHFLLKELDSSKKETANLKTRINQMSKLLYNIRNGAKADLDTCLETISTIDPSKDLEEWNCQIGLLACIKDSLISRIDTSLILFKFDSDICSSAKSVLLCDLLDNACRDVASHLKSKSVEISVDRAFSKVTAFTNGELLKLLIENLVLHCIQAAQLNAKIKLRLLKEDSNEANLVIAIILNNIDLSNLSKAYDSKYTLGYELVKLLAGQIKEFQEDNTLRFEVHIPGIIQEYDKQTNVTTNETKKVSANFAKPYSPKILLAEDDQISQLLISRVLAKQNAKVTQVVSGDEVVRLVRANHDDFDCVLMDIQLIGQDGLETTKQIREYERTNGLQAIPIIAMTAYASSEFEALCKQAGMTGFLTKPVQSSDIEKVLLELGT